MGGGGGRRVGGGGGRRVGGGRMSGRGKRDSVQLRTGSEIVLLIRLKLCACHISPSMFAHFLL